MRHLAKALLRGGSVGMALDGPKGPPLQAKPGTDWLARQSGRPICMLSIQAFPAFRIRSWDHTVIPMPFATISVRISPENFLFSRL